MAWFDSEISSFFFFWERKRRIVVQSDKQWIFKLLTVYIYDYINRYRWLSRLLYSIHSGGGGGVVVGSSYSVTRGFPLFFNSSSLLNNIVFFLIHFYVLPLFSLKKKSNLYDRILDELPWEKKKGNERIFELERGEREREKKQVFLFYFFFSFFYYLYIPGGGSCAGTRAQGR